MATYEDSGVNIEMGDRCSRIAYDFAKQTFAGRKGMIGEPVLNEGGFSGAIDMGDYYLVQNDDGVGTKIEVAELMGKYDTLGYDLVAMVADDAICVGAETISLSNTLDVNKVDEEKITGLMSGLSKACQEHKIIIPGGEIAELGDRLKGYIWNATAIGIVEKSKMITGENLKSGDKLIALRSHGFRSNGISLVRHILKEQFGPYWPEQKFDEEKSWGEVVLTPSKIYTSAILEIHGRYKEESKAEIKALAHITGGGIEGNLNRILKKKNLKAKLENLPEPHDSMKKLMELGKVSEAEAYKTWNMGVGMILISNDFDKIEGILWDHGIESRVIGEIA